MKVYWYGSWKRIKELWVIVQKKQSNEFSERNKWPETNEKTIDRLWTNYTTTEIKMQQIHNRNEITWYCILSRCLKCIKCIFNAPLKNLKEDFEWNSRRQLFVQFTQRAKSESVTKLPLHEVTSWRRRQYWFKPKTWVCVTFSGGMHAYHRPAIDR